jgi:hypothetical protein
MSKFGNPGQVGFNGRPIKNWKSAPTHCNPAHITYIVEKDSRVSAQSQQLASVETVDIDKHRLKSGINERSRSQGQPVIVGVGVELDTPRLGADTGSDS